MTLATTALDWADWIAFALWAGWWLATMLGVYCLGIVHGLRKAPTVTYRPHKNPRRGMGWFWVATGAEEVGVGLP